MNGQIASGEVNRYRFEASKGQRLVISVAARQLIPYIADAVPGWFQPVLTRLRRRRQGGGLQRRLPFQARSDALFEVPEDGEYVLQRSPTPSTAAARISSIASRSANCRL